MFYIFFFFMCNNETAVVKQFLSKIRKEYACSNARL